MNKTRKKNTAPRLYEELRIVTYSMYCELCYNFNTILMKKFLFSIQIFFILSTTAIAQTILIDNSFDPGIGPDQYVLSVNTQNDGKILVGGLFDQFNNGPALGVSAVRLNADGSLDNSFQTDASEVGGTVYKTFVLSDGKILCVGPTRIAWPINNSGVIRLNADGSLDESFDMGGAGFNNAVIDGVLQPDGKLIVCGSFTQFNASPLSRIARLNSDGSLDNTFNPGSGFDFDPQVLALQSDGKILVGGLFEEFNGIERNHLVRLNSDGTLDSSFDPGNQFTDEIRAIAIQADGKILVGGNLIDNFPSGVIRPRIKRLLTDGTNDVSFNPANGFDAVPNSFIIQPDGKIIVGGDFTQYNGEEIRGIARLNVDGTLDNTFDPGNGFQSTSNPGLSFVDALALQPDGKILAVGNFQSYDGTPRNKIARLIGDGGTISITDNSTNLKLNFYPNPATDFIQLDNLPEFSRINLKDNNGKLVYSTIASGKQLSIPTEHLAAGFYVMELSDINHFKIIERILILR